MMDSHKGAFLIKDQVWSLNKILDVRAFSPSCRIDGPETALKGVFINP